VARANFKPACFHMLGLAAIATPKAGRLPLPRASSPLRSTAVSVLLTRSSLNFNDVGIFIITLIALLGEAAGFESWRVATVEMCGGV
jgi:hypothetical protein